jgi:DNA-binding CsgD family transcriptional regulator
MKKCSIEGCDGDLLAHGWCRKHYLRWYKHGDPLFLKDRKEAAKIGAAAVTKHGLWSHPLYPTWHTMMKRCHDPKNAKYATYGGRGITVCERWQDVSLFVEDLGQKPPGMSLDRKDNDGPYSPDNCRWATPVQQARNRPQATLTEAQRAEAIKLYAQHRSPKLVAELVGIKPSDVKNVVYGARRRLATSMPL